MRAASDEERWESALTAGRRRRLILALSGTLCVVAAGALASGFAATDPGRTGLLDRLLVVIDPAPAWTAGSGARAGYALALWQNVAILALAGAGLLLGCLLAMTLVRHRAGQRYARFGAVAAVCAVMVGALRDVLLGWPTRSMLLSPDAIDGCVKACSVLFASAQLVAIPVACVGVGLVLVRSYRWGAVDPAVIRIYPGTMPEGPVGTAYDALRPVPLTVKDARAPSARPGPPDPVAAVVPTGEGTSWLRGYTVPDAPDPARLAAGAPVIGVCLSGGGVRAGSLALGVLQAPAMRAKLLAADYLVSVSGGGYIAGAFQQALRNIAPGQEAVGLPPALSGSPGWVTERDPGTALMPGTAEEDYIRRNASYLANTPGRLLGAFARIAGHTLATLGLVFGPAVAVGIGIGFAYANFWWQPIVFTATTAKGAKPSLGAELSSILPADSLAWIALAIAAPLVVAGLLQALARPAGRAGRRVRAAVAPLLALSAVAAIVAAGIPALLALSAWLTSASTGTTQVAATTLWAVLATYAVSIVSIARVTAEHLQKPSSWLAKAAIIPGAVFNMVLVAIILVLVVAGWLLLAGGAAVATIGAANEAVGRAGGRGALPAPDLIIVAVILVYALVFGVLVDETSLSLHPFYRRRLASAFAVRRMRSPAGAVAEPYPAAEPTTLSTYAARARDGDGDIFPKVIFQASATIGAPRTPAGSNRVSYTFSGDWVGGPEIGYVRTAALERVSPPRIRQDLTVQGAVALSGAAIAASGGGQGAAWYEVLFALTGVRLGAWLPNPAYVMQRYEAVAGEGAIVDPEVSSRDPRIPRKRRLDYLLKEMLGPHSHNGPMLQVTDGGFYDNLGLLELLRRRCTEIYCVDASGDTSRGPATLARAVGLAQEELGVRIRWDPVGSVWNASPGTLDVSALTAPVTDLGSRLGVSPILTGQIQYPQECGTAGLTGRIRVARASLWPELPADVLTYAMGHRPFPSDSTADQWFDDEDYRAYTTLGREMGDLLISGS